MTTPPNYPIFFTNFVFYKKSSPIYIYINVQLKYFIKKKERKRCISDYFQIYILKFFYLINYPTAKFLVIFTYNLL